MLAVVWRVSDERWDVDSFVAEFGLEPSRVWRKGDLGRRGRPRVESGFNLSIDRDDDDLPHALEDIRTFIKANRTALARLRAEGIRSTLDIGITVGADPHYTRSVSLAAADLAAIAAEGIDLEVSAYPSSGDDEPPNT